ncbi:hypothetical protein FPHYL_4700 [Fusarium phyllophilum]|uniref:Uncharacterized protein n=1 Tax=Fusarium phyllophilum TaxID=47803 RepID=A0A8H5K2L7_9HYPO|nr:hypothetical protein FPHYL_4700 [Fusarium phyllophilum]
MQGKRRNHSARLLRPRMSCCINTRSKINTLEQPPIPIRIDPINNQPQVKAHWAIPMLHQISPPTREGIRITQGSNNTPGDQYQVNLPGVQHSMDDPQQRTTNFVNGQQVRTETSSEEAEQNGIRRGTNTISQFDNQFTRTVGTSTSASEAQRDERYPQYTHQSYPGYPRTLDYRGQNDNSSQGQR